MKEPRADLETRAAYTSEQVNMLHIALADVIAGESQMVGRFTIDGIKVIGYLVGALRMDGGTLLLKQTAGDQSPSYSVYNLEKEYESLRRRLGNGDYIRELYNVVGKAMIVRNRKLAVKHDAANSGQAPMFEPLVG